ncbi:ABC transporter ATP-binding protein [Granulosicoccus sp. 3-233]|uniref:ABC transporter ATP-binding protein n=1 Tax=Granulosicoccus sp. 3-233 TaxID=3417969 RepID=UPI003D346CF0
MSLQIAEVGKNFGKHAALRDVTLDIASGELICLLGPSGCGKTTLLRIIAGLESASRGSITLDGEDLMQQAAHQRNFGMVFQSLALFPHLTVEDNITYGLRLRKMPAAARRQRAAELLDMVRLPGVARRSVSMLSGGQRQRVAIARALAIEPRIFLLDEPLSALDAGLRETMQIELRELQQRLGITTIVVTHDQREAMTVADRIAVMNGGTIHQMGKPIDVYRRPADRFVASFIGQTNLLPASWQGEQLLVRDTLFNPDQAARDNRPTQRDGHQTWLSIRPEDLTVLPPDMVSQPDTAVMEAQVRFIRDVGASIEAHLELPARDSLPSQSLVALVNREQVQSLQSGDTARVQLAADSTVVLES